MNPKHPKTTSDRPQAESINLGAAAKMLREELGLSQRAAAQELGMSFVHLCNIENGKASPSPEILEKFYAAWGIDLYMMAVCRLAGVERYPTSMRKPISALRGAWEKQIARLVANRRRQADR